MGSGGMCVGTCTPAQKMMYSQSMGNSHISRPTEQNQQAVNNFANPSITTNSKTTGVSVPASSNSVIDVQA